MVQSYQSPVRVYKHPFELIMAAYERRFPTCDMIPIMAGSEIVLQESSEDEAVEVISRRCKLHAEVPYLLKKIMGVEFIFFIQTNTLDRRRRVLEIEAYNESFSNRVVINETCKYSVHPENSDWTCFEQTAKLDVKSFFGFESTVEKIAMKQYSQNISKGKEIIVHFLEVLKVEGITSVPRWEPKEGIACTTHSESDAGSESDEADDFLDAEDDHSSVVTARQLETTTVSAQGSEAESKSKEMRSSVKKDRKDSLGASRKDKKKKDSVSSDGGSKDKNELEDSRRSVSRKVSLAKNDSLSIEEAESSCCDVQCSPETSSSPTDERDKLDADYIAERLGNLTPLQESRLVQLKKWVNKLQKGKAPNDTTLLRFLRARDFHLEKSREMLSQSLLWRKRNQVDKIINEYQSPPVLVQYFPGGWQYHDKEHRPLFLLRLGQMDVKGLVKSVGEEGLLRHTIAICEEGLRLTEEATRQYKIPITTWTLLVDLEGLTMRHLWRPGIKTLLTIIELMENNYPETMSQVLIIRAPRVFPILWTLVSTFIDEHTRSKFLFYGGNDYQAPGGLIDYLPEEFIPEFLGGKCPSLVGEGGLVPKSLYLPGEEVEHGGKQHLQLSDQSIYRSVYLARGHVHEVLLMIEEAGSVICWDFDVMKSDVMFTVLRTKNTIVTKAKDSEMSSVSLGCNSEAAGAANPAAVSPGKSGGSTAMESAKHVTSSTSEERGSVIEKSWREGEDYFKVEPSLLCHDGESIQGSHVTRHYGTYVLQWRQHEAPSSHTSPLDILDNITHPKTQLMYYFETLRSADYKGSMSSLQSGQSGFSSLSSNTNKSLNSSCPSR